MMLRIIVAAMLLAVFMPAQAENAISTLGPIGHGPHSWGRRRPGMASNHI